MMSDRRRWCSVVLVLVACSGDGPVLPGWVYEEETGSTGAESTDASSSAGPLVECGNGRVDEGEACDGTDLNGETCESLGFSDTGLACVGCIIDMSGCGPVPGMVDVPGDIFEMGSDYASDQQPIRHVQVDRFWMDETEVTVAAYAACVDDGICSEPAMDMHCNWMVAGREDHPVNCVTWFEAETYCGWVEGETKRLPTEAEWEKAARSTDAREYTWGNAPAPICTHVVMNDVTASGIGCGMHSTWAVGSKPLGDSPYGAHDMAGNVYEWIADWYASSYNAGQTNNPIGPAMGTAHALRGGSWSSFSANNLRAAYRSYGTPNYASSFVGFRCARTPPAEL